MILVKLKSIAFNLAIIRQKFGRAGDMYYIVSAFVIFQVEIVFEVGFKSSSSRIWGYSLGYIM